MYLNKHILNNLKKQKKILFYSPDFNLCLSLLVYLQDKYNITTTTDLSIVEAVSENSTVDLVLMDTEPSGVIEKLCENIRIKNSDMPIILTYVYKNQFNEFEKKMKSFVNSIFYKPYDLNEIALKMNSLMVQ